MKVGKAPTLLCPPGTARPPARLAQTGTPSTGIPPHPPTMAPITPMGSCGGTKGERGAFGCGHHPCWHPLALWHRGPACTVPTEQHPCPAAARARHGEGCWPCRPPRCRSAPRRLRPPAPQPPHLAHMCQPVLGVGDARAAACRWPRLPSHPAKAAAVCHAAWGRRTCRQDLAWGYQEVMEPNKPVATATASWCGEHPAPCAHWWVQTHRLACSRGLGCSSEVVKKMGTSW